MITQENSWSKSKNFSDSLGYAGRGLWHAFKTTKNLRRQLFCFLAAFFLAIILNLSLFDLIIIVLVSSIVLILEIINTAFEALADALKPEYNELVRSAKDISAGAVLMSSISAIIIALLLFLPPLVNLVT